jgi:hypothetical protein
MSESNEQPANLRPWHYILLWVIVLVSLALNMYLLAGFNSFQRNVQQEAKRISETLDGLEIENYEVPVVVDETFSVSLTVPFSDTFEVPIKTTVPVSTSIAVDETISVPFSDVVSLDRDVQVFLSVLGQSIPVNIPIRADIPIDLQTDVPIKLQVPVEAEIPIDLLIEVPVHTEVPIEADIPVQMDFPVTVPLEEMGLNALLAQLQEGLQVLAGEKQP